MQMHIMLLAVKTNAYIKRTKCVFCAHTHTHRGTRCTRLYGAEIHTCALSSHISFPLVGRSHRRLFPARGHTLIVGIALAPLPGAGRLALRVLPAGGHRRAGGCARGCPVPSAALQMFVFLSSFR